MKALVLSIYIFVAFLTMVAFLIMDSIDKNSKTIQCDPVSIVVGLLWPITILVSTTFYSFDLLQKAKIKNPFYKEMDD